MKKLFSTKTILLSMILSSFFLTSCLSTYLIPDKMEKNDLGKKIINCVNKDENYLKGQFGTPTKVKDYDNGLKWVYYEEWGTYNTKKVGNTQYYTDYRFIKFKVDSDGLVEDYFVSDGYNIEYNANETVKTVAFWGEIATYFLIAMAIGL